MRNISGRIVPNAIVYGISGADEGLASNEKTAGQGYKKFYETPVFQFELSLRDIIMQDVIRSEACSYNALASV